MRVISGKIFALRIPFVETFAHSAKKRRYCDSIVVRLDLDDGTTGYGEGVARSYVTGETCESSIEHIRNSLFPALEGIGLPEIRIAVDPFETLQPISESLPSWESPDGVVRNAARAAVELALIDCLLKSERISLGAVIPPKRDCVTYSGVITAGTTERAVQHARRFKFLAVRDVKIKIAEYDDVSRVAAVRQVMGDRVSLRVDANGSFDLKGAIEISERLAESNIAAFEQPIARGDLEAWKELRSRSPIPLMADESLVTCEDAEELIRNSACDFFNLRVSKCGGITDTLRLAKIAQKNGIRLQLGCHVGESALLSAAGRHIAAHLETAEFVEGSFGDLLLEEDISRNRIHFGYGGKAPVLRGLGLCIDVREDLLEGYSHAVVELKSRRAVYA